MINKKGNITIYGLMLALVIIILALALAPAVKEFNDRAMNETDGDFIGMQCENETISDFTRAGCIATDLSFFYFISGLILLAGVIITARIIFA